MHQVEDIDTERVLPARGQFLLQRRKSWGPTLGSSTTNSPSIKSFSLAFSLVMALAMAGNFPGQSETRSGSAAWPYRVVEARLQAVTIELDLMDPVAAVGRLVGEGGKAGLSEIGQGIGVSRLRPCATA